MATWQYKELKNQTYLDVNSEMDLHIHEISQRARKVTSDDSKDKHKKEEIKRKVRLCGKL